MTEINGTSGNENLYGTEDSDTINSFAGNDTMEGGQSDDTYIYNIGDGHDIIHDNGVTDDGLDRILFGTGITEEDITLNRSTESDRHLVITFENNPNDSITIQYQFHYPRFKHRERN